MADKLISFRPHRKNRDGSYDSICLVCFATIASARREEDLRGPEKSHVCRPATLKQQAFDRKQPSK
jgi:hypothetical protein